MSRIYEIYVNSFYFMTTTMTTIGYGDKHNKGEEEFERLYLMIVIFSGIAMFTLIT